MRYVSQGHILPAVLRPSHPNMARYTAAEAATAIQGWWRELQYKRFWAQDDPPCLCSWCVCYPDDRDVDGAEAEQEEEVD